MGGREKLWKLLKTRKNGISSLVSISNNPQDFLFPQLDYLTERRVKTMDKQVSLELVLQYVSQLCSPCQEKWRQMMVPTLKHPDGERQHRSRMKRKMDELISQVSKETGIPTDMMHLKTNDSKIVEARRKVSIRARNYGIPYTFIAGVFHKHHTTIIHLVEGKRPHAPVKKANSR